MLSGPHGDRYIAYWLVFISNWSCAISDTLVFCNAISAGLMFYYLSKQKGDSIAAIVGSCNFPNEIVLDQLLCYIIKFTIWAPI